MQVHLFVIAIRDKGGTLGVAINVTIRTRSFRGDLSVMTLQNPGILGDLAQVPICKDEN